MQNATFVAARVRKRVKKRINGVSANWAWRMSQWTAPLRLLPDFIIIGTQKGGTSSLYGHLAQHPWILPAKKKEIHFFDTENFAKGTNWYRAHFNLKLRKRYLGRSSGHNTLTGEASPYYLFYPHAPARISKLLPGTKLIVMLRDPVDRALSHYYHQVRKRREPLSFEAAIEAEDERLRGEYDRILQDATYYSYPYWAYSYVARGVYVNQIRNWLSVFPREQFFFIKSEDFFIDPARKFKDTLRFLDMPNVELAEYEKLNAGRYTGIPLTLRRRLSEYFRPYNQKLYELVGIDFGWES